MAIAAVICAQRLRRQREEKKRGDRARIQRVFSCFAGDGRAGRLDFAGVTQLLQTVVHGIPRASEDHIGDDYERPDPELVELTLAACGSILPPGESVAPVLPPTGGQDTADTTEEDGGGGEQMLLPRRDVRGIRMQAGLTRQTSPVRIVASEDDSAAAEAEGDEDDAAAAARAEAARRLAAERRRARMYITRPQLLALIRYYQQQRREKRMFSDLFGRFEDPDTPGVLRHAQMLRLLTVLGNTVVPKDDDVEYLCAWALGLSAYSRAQWHESVYAFCVVAAHRHGVPPVVCRKVVVEYLGPWAQQLELLQKKHTRELKKILSKWVSMAAERKRLSQRSRRSRRRRGEGGGDGASTRMCTIS